MVKCDPQTVGNWLKRHNIQRRSKSEAQSLKYEAYRQRDWLYQKYICERLSTHQISALIGADNATVLRWLRENQIPLRSKSESLLGEAHPLFGKHLTEEHRKKISGENGGGWCGGKSFEPYCPKFNKLLKERIRAKFGRICFLCSSTENDQRHCIHHVDYNKNSICNGKEWPLLPLCPKCHGKTNFNRWYWFNLLINYWAMNSEIDFNVGLNGRSFFTENAIKRRTSTSLNPAL